MHKKDITEKAAAFETALQDFLEQIKKVPVNQWHQKPDDNSWSVIQVAEHIFASESGTLGYMMKKSSGGWDTLEITREEQNVNSSELNKRLTSGERYTAPAILPQPTNSTTPVEVEQNWKALRVKFNEFINGIDPMHYDKLVFRQPAAGMLNILQALDFLTMHLRHHLPQIERIAAAIK
jgi:hypothetical protein